MYISTILETERLKLVPLDLERVSPDEHETIERQLGLKLASMILGEQIDREIKAAMRNSLEKIIRDKKENQWYTDWESVLIVHKGENTIIGGFCIQRVPDSLGEVQIGYMIRPEYRNMGYMTEALRKGIMWIFERPDVSAVIAETTKSNIPSHRVLEKIGMKIYKETDRSYWWKRKRCV